MHRVAVVSSVYGDYDKIKIPPEQDIECEFVLVTGEPVDCAPWRNVVEPRPRVHPRLASRVAKCHPENYTGAETIIWADGNIEIMTSGFAQWCVDSLGDEPLCQLKQERECLHEEVDASLCQDKWFGDPIAEAAEYYISKGYPDDYGIWWCGLNIQSRYRPNFGDQWMAEMVRWTAQDQLAYSYLLWRYDLIPKPLEFSYQVMCELDPEHEEDNRRAYDPAVKDYNKVYIIETGRRAEHFALRYHPVNK